MQCSLCSVVQSSAVGVVAVVIAVVVAVVVGSVV